MNKYQEKVKKYGELPFQTQGYPMFYVIRGDVHCADCAAEEPENIENHAIHWEGQPLHCEECNEELESAYGDPEDF